MEELDNDNNKLRLSPKHGTYQYTYFPVSKLSILASPHKMIYWTFYGTFGAVENVSTFIISVTITSIKWLFIISLYFTLLLTPLFVVLIMWLTCLHYVFL